MLDALPNSPKMKARFWQHQQNRWQGFGRTCWDDCGTFHAMEARMDARLVMEVGRGVAWMLGPSLRSLSLSFAWSPGELLLLLFVVFVSPSTCLVLVMPIYDHMVNLSFEYWKIKAKILLCQVEFALGFTPSTMQFPSNVSHPQQQDLLYYLSSGNFLFDSGNLGLC